MFKRIVKGWGIALSLAAGALPTVAETISSNWTLTEDCDLREEPVTISAGATVDLNGHTLTVKGLSCAGEIVDGNAGEVGRLRVDVSDGASYAVTGSCDVRVEVLDGSSLSSPGDLRCFGANLEVNGTVCLNRQRLRVAGLGGSGCLCNMAFRYYKFKVDDVRDIQQGQLQIGEFKLFSGATEISHAYRNISYDLNSSFSNYAPDKCFDGMLGEPNKWFDNRSTDLMYFVLDYGEPCVVTRYQWYTADDTPTCEWRNPKSWRLQGSNDGANWQDLDVVENNMSVTTAGGQCAYDKVLTVDQDGSLEVEVPGMVAVAYRYYKFTVDEVRELEAWCQLPMMQIGEFKLFSGDDDVSRQWRNIDYEKNGYSYIAYSPEKCFDGLLGEPNKWFDERAGQTYFVLDYGEPLVITRYQWYTASDTADCPNRVPKSWRFQGSNDGTNWQDLDVVENNTSVTTAGDQCAYDKVLVLNRELTAHLAGVPTLVKSGSGQLLVPDAEIASVAKVVVNAGELTIKNAGGTSTGEIWVADGFSVEEGAVMESTGSRTLTFAGDCELAGTLNQKGDSSIQIAGTLSGAGTLAGAHVRFSGDSNCWRLVADDTGFTSKVDTSGVTDAAFLSGLKNVQIAFAGDTPTSKVFTICAAGDFSQDDANSIAIEVKDANEQQIADCWLEVAEGYLKVHLDEGGQVPITAEWTNATGDGDLTKPANWVCRDRNGQKIEDAVPTSATAILIGSNSSFVCTDAVSLVCGKIKFEPGASLAADCDWRGLAGIPFEGTLDLAGHTLTVGSLRGSAQLINTAGGEGFKYYRFTLVKTRGMEEHAQVEYYNDMPQIGEVKLFNGTNDVTRPYRRLVFEESTFNFYYGDFTPVKVVDGDLETKWYDDRANNPDLDDRMWFILEYDAPLVLTHYEWYTANDTEVARFRQPQEWRLEGSNDGESWTLLDEIHKRVDVANRALAYRGPVAPQATLSAEVRIDVPAGAVETNAEVALDGRLRLVKIGEGTFVAAKDGQTYTGGTVVREGIVKPGVPDGCVYPFGSQNTCLTVEEGAQYWDDMYAPWATQNLRFRIAGTGPDGTGAIRTTHNAPGGINNAEKGWGVALELAGDAEIARDAYAFALIANGWLEFPLTLNGHTLTFTSDTASDSYLLVSSLRGTPGDTGTIVVGDNLMFYPYHEYDSDLSNYTLVISERASYTTETDSNARNLIVSNLTYRSTSASSQTARLTTVLGCYAPESTASAPKVQLGDATHLAPQLDLSARTTPFDIAFGGGLSFTPGTTVGVRLGDRSVPQSEPLLSWREETRPTEVTFVSVEKRGYLVVKDDGLYLYSGLLIIVR